MGHIGSSYDVIIFRIMLRNTLTPASEYTKFLLANQFVEFAVLSRIALLPFWGGLTQRFIFNDGIIVT